MSLFDERPVDTLVRLGRREAAATIIANHWDGSVPAAYEAWDTLFHWTGLKVVIQDYGDMSMMSMGAFLLGYADPEVDAAVKAAIDAGSASTLNAPEEVELAELLCELHPWAEMVRYARSGGEAMMIAVRIARAHTKARQGRLLRLSRLVRLVSGRQPADEDALDPAVPVWIPQASRAGSGAPRSRSAQSAPRQLGDRGRAPRRPRRHGAAARPPAPAFSSRPRDRADIGAVLIFDG
jgi:hypothetical protein